jgi:hypothetical protein
MGTEVSIRGVNGDRGLNKGCEWGGFLKQPKATTANVLWNESEVF